MFEQKLVGVRVAQRNNQVSYTLREIRWSSPQKSELGLTTFCIYTSPFLQTLKAQKCHLVVHTTPPPTVGESEFELMALRNGSFHPCYEFWCPQGL